MPRTETKFHGKAKRKSYVIISRNGSTYPLGCVSVCVTL